MPVNPKAINLLEKQLRRSEEDNSDSPCHLCKASIPPGTLGNKQRKQIDVALLHDPETKRAGLFANTKIPIEHRFDWQGFGEGFFRPIRDFVDKLCKTNLKVNRTHTFPTSLDAATTVPT